MNHRNEFPELLDRLGCKTAAEIGVAEGYFARRLLQSRIEKLYLIDPWQTANLDDERVEVIWEASPDVAGRFDDGSIDFVYIDAMHEYPAVLADLRAWWPKTRVMLAGHDYVPWNTVVGCPCGVIPAVEQFAIEHGLHVQVTGAEDNMISRFNLAWQAAERDAGLWAEDFPSWYIIK